MTNCIYSKKSLKRIREHNLCEHHTNIKINNDLLYTLYDRRDRIHILNALTLEHLYTLKMNIEIKEYTIFNILSDTLFCIHDANKIYYTSLI